MNLSPEACSTLPIGNVFGNGLRMKTDKKSSKNGKAFDFSKFPRRRIALLILYLGWDYDGLVTQENTSNTVEQALLEALINTKLIENKEAAKLSRCGRTDKGVSGFRNVVSVIVRSTDVSGHGVFWPHGDVDNSERIKSTSELRYDNIVNNVLPNTVKVLAWAPVEIDFNARFNCISRSYVYLFPLGTLNIENMKTALEYLVGSHDFRNFCCIDMNKARIETCYIRDIFEASISPLDSTAENDPYQMYQLKIKGSGFLWHMIRCVVSILYDIGRGVEDVSLVSRLLDIASQPAKPQYCMARDVPLCFFDATYANNSFDWKANMSADVIQRVFNGLEAKWCELETKAGIVKTMMNEMKTFGVIGDLHNGIHTHITALRPSATKPHIPILKRPTCDSLETKICKFEKKRKVEE